MKKFLIPILSVALVSCMSSSTEEQQVSTGTKLKVGQHEIVTGKDVITTVMPQNKNVRDLVHGKEVFLGIGAVEGQGENLANGVAQLHVFEDGYSKASVRVNIEQSAPGTFYQAWLMRDINDEKIVLDTLRDRFRDTRHFGYLEIDKDISGYTDLIVTLQKIGGSDEPSDIVAKATIKKVER